MLRESNVEVIRCWLAASEPFPNNVRFSVETFTDFLAGLERKISELDATDVECAASRVSDPDRRERLLTWRWNRAEVPLVHFGTWRTVGGLPFEACKGSAVDAAAFVRANPDPPSELHDLTAVQKYRDTVNRIQRLRDVAPVVSDFPLFAVQVAAECQRGREGCVLLPYSSEDGSHRAIALALAGHQCITAWIGSPP